MKHTPSLRSRSPSTVFLLGSFPRTSVRFFTVSSLLTVFEGYVWWSVPHVSAFFPTMGAPQTDTRSPCLVLERVPSDRYQKSEICTDEQTDRSPKNVSTRTKSRRDLLARTTDLASETAPEVLLQIRPSATEAVTGRKVECFSNNSSKLS